MNIEPAELLKLVQQAKYKVAVMVRPMAPARTAFNLLLLEIASAYDEETQAQLKALAFEEMF